MTTTPTVWKPEYGLNSFTNSLQADAAIVDIGGGRFVAVWTDYDTSVADTAGINLVGQIFDAEGNSFGSPFQVNETAGDGHQQNATVTGRPGGGFASAYESETIVTGPLVKQEIIVDIFDAGGGHVSGATIQADDGDKVWNPSIAMRSDGSYLVTYTRERDGDDTFDVVARRVSASGTIGDEVVIFDSSGTTPHAAEAMALANGNYVVAYQSFLGAGDNNVEFKIIGQTGDVPGGTGFQVSLNAADETDVQVAALKGGRFVVAWESNPGSGTDIRYSVYDGGTGVEVKANQFGGGFLANTVTAGSQSSPDVTALADGGFVVVWKDSPRDGLYGQRFDATGEKVGGEFLAASGARFDPVLAGLGDGRFVTGSNTDVAPNADVFGTILDPRETTISGDALANVITSRVDGATVNGLGGDDTLLGQGGADTLDGGSGVDTMKGRGGNDFLFGGNNDDEMDGGAGADAMEGGAGNDTYIVDDAGDTAVEGAGQGTDLVQASVSFTLGANVENLTLTGSGGIAGTGNALANVITGNAGANRINGGAGIDVLIGGGGPDTFVFDASIKPKKQAAANADLITDFNPAEDTIELAAAMFPKLKLGVLKKKAFDSGKKKPAKDKHLVYYDEKQGDLSYDANGKKQKGKGDVLIATLDPGLDLTAADIVVA